MKLLLSIAFLIFSDVSFAKGRAVAPLVLVGIMEDLKLENGKVTILFTGTISESDWAQRDWKLNASVTKLPVTVERTFFFKPSDDAFGFSFEKEKTRTEECLRNVKMLEFTIPKPVVSFNQFAIQKITGDVAQIEGCGWEVKPGVGNKVNDAKTAAALARSALEKRPVLFPDMDFSSPQHIEKTKTRYGREVWRVDFQSKPDNDAGYYPRGVVVFIDALTGEHYSRLKEASE